MGKKDSHLTKVEPKDILDEQYIADYLESHAKISTWNRTQLYLIVESITIAEAYYYYPGSALYLLRLLKTNNSTQGKNDALKEHLIQYSYAMAHVDDAH